MKNKLYFVWFFMLIFMLTGCMDKPSSPSTIDSSSAGVEKNVSKSQTQADTTILPMEYQEVLEDYDALIAFRLSDDFEEEYNSGVFIELKSTLKDDLAENAELSSNWYDMVVEMTTYGRFSLTEDFGYVLKDIDADGFSELFWINRDREILAVFTIFEGKAKLIDAFRSRYACRIMENDEIIICSQGTVYEVVRLKKGSNELTILAIFGVDNFSSEESKYFENIDGENKPISEDRFKELCSIYPFEFSQEWNNLNFFATSNSLQ